MAEHQRQDRVSQYTLSAQTIELPAAEAALLEEHLESLQYLGFDLETFGANTFVIRSVPALLTDADPVEVVHGILSDLERGDVAGESAIEDKIVQRVCKQAAVKAGTILSLEEMQGLIRQLERSESPHTCPHGRPTMLHMTSERLAHEFGRS
jgi:DNA mismatch repair protein MutL